MSAVDGVESPRQEEAFELHCRCRVLPVMVSEYMLVQACKKSKMVGLAEYQRTMS